jgi:hypothetical protein
MIRFLLLILIAVATLGIVYFATHPELFDKVWLYLIGLAGAIIKFVQVLWEKIKGFAKDVETHLQQEQQNKQNQQAKPKAPVIIQNNSEAVG